MARKYLSDDELRKILEYSDSDNEYEISDEDESDTEDNLEEQIEIPDEIDVEDNLDIDIPTEPVTFYSSKAGFQWRSSPIPTSRRRAHNMVNSTVGLKNASLQITSVQEAFKLFVTDDMLSHICEYTNMWGKQNTDKKNEGNLNKIQWTDVTVDELQAFIGVLIASGRNRGRKLHISEMWTQSAMFKQPYFTAVLSRNRFKQIFRCIRFDDPETRKQRMEVSNDPLEAIRTIYDKFVSNCLDNYSPNTNVTVDERLATFRGKCPFRVYIKSKPGRYGIKIWVCADSDTAYILNSQVYTGMINNKREVNQGQRVVLDMVKPYFGTWRGVTTDNFFTSVPLAEQLFEKKITITGTLRMNKREIPQQFLANTRRELYSSLFGFTDNMTLVSHVPKKNKAVILLSTQFNDAETDTTSEKKKPIINLHYNTNKGAVDTGDKMTREYSCVRATRRWPLRLFMEILDMASLNAYIVFSEKFPDWSKHKGRRRQFLQILSQQLALPNVKTRERNSRGKQKSILDAISLFLIENGERVETSHESTEPVASTSTRCQFCPRREDRKSRIKCSECGKTVCNMHRKEVKKFFCIDCQNDS